jgi:hypothetical protein
MGLFTKASWREEEVRMMLARVRCEITVPKVYSQL